MLPCGTAATNDRTQAVFAVANVDNNGARKERAGWENGHCTLDSVHIIDMKYMHCTLRSVLVGTQVKL